MVADFLGKQLGRSSALGTILGGLGSWRPASEEEIEKYKTQDYPEWLKSVRRALPVLISRLNAISCEIPFCVSISNRGFVNASNVRLTVTAYDGIQLLDSLAEEAEQERDKLLSLPPFPEAPRGRYVSAASALVTLSSRMPKHILPDLMPRKRNPTGFYYTDVPSVPMERLELTCEALPHQGDSYILGFRLLIPKEGIGKQPRIRVRVEASNLQKPLEKFVKVSPIFEAGDFAERVEKFKQRLNQRALSDGIEP